MSPNDVSADSDRIFLVSSSSSDSESFMKEDLNNDEAPVNKEWNAIERTLYEEAGEQVTDPRLLKECKLWRDTFPHYRIKGNKINVQKNTQTVESHYNLSKLEEKKFCIKNKVVEELVERLIAKFNLSKQDCDPPPAELDNKNDIQLSKVHDTPKNRFSDPSLKSNDFNPTTKGEIKSVISNSKEESYFERGKTTANENEKFKRDSKTAREKMEEYPCQIFDDCGKEIKPFDNSRKNTLPKPVNFSSQNPESKKAYGKSNTKEIIGLKCLEKQTSGRIHPTPPSDCLSNLVKPFQSTKKLDNKYEGLLERIMERRYNEVNTTRHCRNTSSGIETRSCQESLEKMRIASGFAERMGKNGHLPRINKFHNNWLQRDETNSYYYVAFEDFSVNKIKCTHPKAAQVSNLLKEERNQNEIHEKLIKELKRATYLNYKRPPKKSGVLEEVNLKRPKPLKATEKAGRSQKSSSCGDLPKNGKKDPKNRHVKGGWENGKNESSVKTRAKSIILNNFRESKLNGNETLLLPPIENGIICTELTARPRLGPSKRH